MRNRFLCLCLALVMVLPLVLGSCTQVVEPPDVPANVYTLYCITGDTTTDEAITYLNTIMEAKAAERNKTFAAKGEAFLAENAQREGVFVTESGLQYEVITMGEGEKPTAESTVKVHYHGTLIDGTVFDSSVERGEPIEFPLNGVIKGWTEGLQLMPIGSKFRLFIPYQLAYGEQGAGELIGPCEALIFEVELLDIVK